MLNRRLRVGKKPNIGHRLSHISHQELIWNRVKNFSLDTLGNKVFFYSDKALLW